MNTTTEMTEETELNQHNLDINIDRRDVKTKWGLPKVSDITNARRALGQPDWQNSKMSEADATELNQYFSLVLDRKLSPDDAILQVASERNGRAAYCNEIDPDAIAKPSDAKRDEAEEKGAAIQAIQQATQQGNVGLAEAGSQMALTNMQSLKVGYAQTLVAELSDFGNALRSNLTVLSEASAATPLDLRAASLPTAQLSQPVESRRLEPHKATQKQLSKGALVEQTNALSEVCSQLGILLAQQQIERVKGERFFCILLVFTLSKLQKKWDFKESLFQDFINWLNTGGW